MKKQVSKRVRWSKRAMNGECRFRDKDANHLNGESGFFIAAPGSGHSKLTRFIPSVMLCAWPVRCSIR